MCEYKVYLDGKLVGDDIVYVKLEGDHLILRNALGLETRIEGCEVVEVDSLRERIVLRPIKRESRVLGGLEDSGIRQGRGG